MRIALRQLAKSPGFTAVVVSTLALGIGATTAIFSAVNALILRPLPVKDPDQLVLIVMPFMPPGASFGTEPVSWRLYEQFRDRAHSLLDVFLADDHFQTRPFVATGLGASVTDFVRVGHVSGNFFSVLGVPARHGRNLTPEDDRSDQPQAVAVISHAFWQQRFGGDPSVIGRTALIEKVPFTVIGVTAPGFFGTEVGRDIDVWCPLQTMRLLAPGEPEPDPDDGVGLAMGRLRPGVSPEEARAALAVIFQQDIARRAEGKNLNNPVLRSLYVNRTLELHPGAGGYHLRNSLREQFGRPVVILMAVVGVGLLVACANVAGLLLARGATRQRELAVRAALGAGRGRLLGLFLAESALLALAGGLLGILVAYWGTAFLANYLPTTDGTLDLAPDGRVLVFAFVLTAATGILCGLVPALRASRIDLTTAMKNQAGTLAGGAGQRLNQLLVVAQIALSFVLLVSAGVFGRTLQNLRTLDASFSRENLLLFSVDSGQDYAGARGAELYFRILDRMETLPGTRSATMALRTPLLDKGRGARFDVEGYTPAPNEIVGGQVFEIGPRFLGTMGLPLLAGRDFTVADFAAGAKPVVVIGESMARNFFGRTDPLGRHVKCGGRTLEIIGIAKDTKSYGSLRDKPRFTLYDPYQANNPELHEMTFLVRTKANPLSLAADVRTVVRQLAPEARVLALRPMDAAVDEALARERAVAQLSGVFSAFTLALASLGLYGLLSYGVVRRTREIGVRIAFGAQRRDVVALILKQGLTLALLGCAAGITGALAAARFTGSLLYGVTPFDPPTMVATASLMVAVALLACWLPVHRATQVDPMTALRTE